MDAAGALRRAVEQARAGDCAGALATLDPLAAALLPGPERMQVQLVRLGCLGPVGRAREIGAVHAELAAVAPDNPAVRGYGVMAAAIADDYALAATRLTEAADRVPAALALVPADLFRGIVQKLGEQRRLPLRDRLFVALARAEWKPGDRPDLSEAVAQGAIDALLARGELAEAELLLPRITMPELLVSMATERHYQPLWPAIERQLGPGSSVAVDRFATQQIDAFSRTPDDLKIRRETVRAFLLLGRYAEAAELAEPVAIGNGMGEDAVAIVRYRGQALAALGRRSEAVAQMRGFSALGADGPTSSGVVGLAELLDEQGLPGEALEVARTGISRGDRALSAWGKAWLRRTEVCALAALKREAEARQIGDALLASAADNQPAAIEAMLCDGRTDDAAKVAIATLATRDGAGTLVDQFQPEAATWAPSRSRLRALWQPLLARPDVKAAFDRAARVLPEGLRPPREPRPIPRPPGVDPGSTT